MDVAGGPVQDVLYHYYTLTRIAASTWGCSLIRAREIYTKVIRAAIAYGAGVFHNPHQPTYAKALQASQNKCLRRVAGAYKATPIQNLELETYCPPLDLYLNKRLADFEDRLRYTGMGEKIQEACKAIRAQLRNRRDGREHQDPSPRISNNGQRHGHHPYRHHHHHPQAGDANKRSP